MRHARGMENERSLARIRLRPDVAPHTTHITERRPATIEQPIRTPPPPTTIARKQIVEVARVIGTGAFRKFCQQ